ncbi:MAG: S-layer homology domain-containing protein [Cyanobacteria bacterium P01_F01_bin.42]
MPNVNAPFPDPWDQNASDSVPLDAESETIQGEKASDFETLIPNVAAPEASAEDEFGLNELRSLLTDTGDITEQSTDTTLTDAENFLAATSSIQAEPTATEFDALLSFLEIESAVGTDSTLGHDDSASLDLEAAPAITSVAPEPVAPEVKSVDPMRENAASVSTAASSLASRSESSDPVLSGSTVSSPAGISTYRRILSGRRPISAFVLIFAGMGGLINYGWSQANIPNLLETGSKEPIFALLADDDDDSEEEEGRQNEDIDPATALEPSSGFSAAVADSQPSTPGSSALDSLTPGATAVQDSATLDDLNLPTPSGPIQATQNISNRPFEPSATDDSPTASLVEPDQPAESGSSSRSTEPNRQVPPTIDISDVPSDYWARPYVEALYERGVLPDFPNGKFQPDKPVTRAELAASIQQSFQDVAQGSSANFSDIPNEYWAKDAIGYAVNSGFMSGYSDEIFQPNQNMPRYQVLVSLASGLGIEKIKDSAAAAEVLANFSDVDVLPQWAIGLVAASRQANLIINQPGGEAQLRPDRPATRAEASAMIYQALVHAGEIEDTVKREP